MMDKKSTLLSVLSIVLLFSLPGCGKKSKKMEEPSKAKQMGKRADLFSRVDMPLAEDDLQAADDSMRSLFDSDLDDFIAFDDSDFDSATEQDAYAWTDAVKAEKELTVHFRYAEDALVADEAKKVEKQAKAIKARLDEEKEAGKSPIVRVEGHADTTGSASQNMVITGGRSKSVGDLLVAHGIDRNDIALVPCGKEMPLAASGSIDAQWVNRRAEVSIVDRQA